MQQTIHTPILQQDIAVAMKGYKSSECLLQLYLSPDSFAFGELGYENKLLHSFKKYSLPPIPTTAAMIESLQWLFDNDETLLQKYFSTTLSYFSQETLLIPSSDQLAGSSGLLSDDPTMLQRHTPIAALNADLYFSIPLAVESFFSKNQCYEISHASAYLITHLLSRQKFIRSKTVYAHLQSGLLEIIAFDKDSLLLHNIFPITSAEDFIYYLLSSYEGLGFNTSIVNCVLMGDIEKPSKIFDHIFKYIKHFEFAKEPIHIKYSSAFEDIPMHRFYSFFSSVPG